MKYEIKLSSQALADLDDIFKYISVKLCEKEVAANLLGVLEKSIMSLDEMPGRYKVYDNEPWKSRNLHIMPVKNYLVFYIPDNDNKVVNIVRVIYGSRDIENVLN